YPCSFVFSSRRRHTSFSRDWSSDVCSSDLILLGLTATPERHDGSDILSDFCNVIAAEIRLPEAINRRLLSPFQYFGIDDDTDLQIGRASCRERVKTSSTSSSLQKTDTHREK